MHKFVLYINFNSILSLFTFTPSSPEAYFNSTYNSKSTTKYFKSFIFLFRQSIIFIVNFQNSLIFLYKLDFLNSYSNHPFFNSIVLLFMKFFHFLQKNSLKIFLNILSLFQLITYTISFI